MGIGANLSNEVKQWGTLAMVIVVVSIILIKFKTPVCGSSNTGYEWNETASLCMSTTNNSLNSSIGEIGTTINTFMTGFQEPGNWIIIVIVGLVGFALIKLFGKKKK